MKLRKINFSSILFSSVAVAAISLFTMGCGGDKKNETSKNKEAAGDKSTSDKKPSLTKGKKENPKSNAKPIKVVSKLPHKDLDPMSTDKGVVAGRVLIDASGQDSSGKKMKLSDYQGKVILLDVWASW